MSDSFRELIGPPILYVLEVRDLIEGDPDSVKPVAVRKRCKELLGRFDGRGALADHYRLAKHAIVYWTDEVLINSVWSYATDWRHDPLELEYFGTRDRAWRFYANAELARGLDGNEALEVFATCAALGFQGVYRGGQLPELQTQPEFVPAMAHAGAPRTVFSTELDTSTIEAKFEDVAAMLPRKRSEWLSSVFVQVLGEALPPFQSGEPYDSMRNADPLLNGAVLKKWLVVLFVAAVVSAALLVHRSSI